MKKTYTASTNKVDMAARYAKHLSVHKEPHLAVGWGSRESQKTRFRLLKEVGIQSTHTVLDVGSGLGDFFGYLKLEKFTGHYVGIDAIDQMVEKASLRFPNANFLCHDAIDLSNLFEENAFDFVVASGIFAYCVDEQYEYLRSIAKSMLYVSKVAVALNCLSTFGSHPVPSESQFDPAQTFNILHALTPWVNLRHEYLSHDFTVYLYKSQK